MNNNSQTARNTRSNGNAAKARGSRAKAISPIEAEIVDLENERDGTVDTTRNGTTTRRFNFARRALASEYERDNAKATEAAKRAQRKNILLSSAVQTLAEARDLSNTVGASQAEIGRLSGRAAFALYQGMSEGVITLEETTAKLGDVWGFRKKGDAKTMVQPGDKEASKTPFGNGEEIRKRVIRMTKAEEFAHSGQGDRFFSDVPEAKRDEFRQAVTAIIEAVQLPEPPEGLEGDDLAAFIENAKANQMPLWTAYDKLTAARKEAMEGRQTVQPAFDPKRVMQLVEGLRSEGAIDRLNANKALSLAYEALAEALVELDEAPVPELPEELTAPAPVEPAVTLQ